MVYRRITHPFYPVIINNHHYIATGKTSATVYRQTIYVHSCRTYIYAFNVYSVQLSRQREIYLPISLCQLALVHVVEI